MQAFHWNLSQAHRPTSPRGPDTNSGAFPTATCPSGPKVQNASEIRGLLSSPIFILDCSDKAPSLLTTTQTEAQVESAREHPEAGHVDVVWTSAHGLRRLGKECLGLGRGPKSQYPVPITEMVKPLSHDK